MIMVDKKLFESCLEKAAKENNEELFSILEKFHTCTNTIGVEVWEAHLSPKEELKFHLAIMKS